MQTHDPPRALGDDNIRTLVGLCAMPVIEKLALGETRGEAPFGSMSVEEAQEAAGISEGVTDQIVETNSQGRL